MILRAFDASNSIILFVVAFIYLIAQILFLVTLQNTVAAVDRRNRHLNPGQVFLMLIPIFNYLWVYWMVTRIADSIEDELRARKMPTPLNRPGYNVGLGYAISLTAGTVFRFIPYMNVVAGFAALVALVLWIIYWVQIHNYRRALETNAGFYTSMQEPKPLNDTGHHPVYPPQQQQHYQPPFNPQQQYQQPYYGQQQPPPEEKQNMEQQPPDNSRWMRPENKTPEDNLNN